MPVQNGNTCTEVWLVYVARVWIFKMTNLHACFRYFGAYSSMCNPDTMHCLPSQLYTMYNTRTESWSMHACHCKKYECPEFCCTLVTGYVHCSLHLHTVASAHAAQLTWWDSVLRVSWSRLRLHDTAPLQPTEQEHPSNLPNTTRHPFSMCFIDAITYNMQAALLRS